MNNLTIEAYNGQIEYVEQCRINATLRWGSYNKKLDTLAYGQYFILSSE